MFSLDLMRVLSLSIWIRKRNVDRQKTQLSRWRLSWSGLLLGLGVGCICTVLDGGGQEGLSSVYAQAPSTTISSSTSDKTSIASTSPPSGEKSLQSKSTDPNKIFLW